MFYQVVHAFLGYVSQLIETILFHDVLAYVFFIGILGFVIEVIRFIYALNSSDLGNRSSYHRKGNKD